MANAIELATELGKAIIEDERYKAFKAAEAAHDNDEELQSLINEYNLIKINLMNEMQKSDKDENRVKELQAKLRESYTVVMENEVMATYMRAKEDADAFVNSVYNTLSFAITGEEPHSCSGSCESCGGCH